MEKFGFKSNLELLIYINKHNSLPKIQTDPFQKRDQNIDLKYETVINCVKLMNEVNYIFLNIKNITFAN